MGVFKRIRKYKSGSKSAYWYIRYWVEGKEKKESVGKVGRITKTIAQTRLEERKRQVRLGQLNMLDSKIPTLENFSGTYIEYVRDIKCNRSWKSAVQYLKTINKKFGKKKLSSISPNDIDNYKLERLQNLKPASVNRELACLSHLINYAKRHGRYFGDNPVSISKLLPENNKKERILTSIEEELLINNSSKYLEAILICALNTGMRKNEIITLRWHNVDMEKNTITIEHTNTKNKKTRKIPINSKLRKTLFEQKIKVGSSNYVFLSSKGKPYKRHDSLNQAFKSARDKAGIINLRFHDLRHTSATRMIETDASIVAVSKILGHADLKTTMRYLHPDNSLIDAVENLSNYESNRTQNRTHKLTNHVE